MYLSHQEIVDDMLLFRMSEAAKRAFRTMSDHDLLVASATIGRTIRNHYHLWDPENPYTMLNYQPEIVDGVDNNPKHPDNFSFAILETIRQRMQ